MSPSAACMGVIDDILAFSACSLSFFEDVRSVLRKDGLGGGLGGEAGIRSSSSDESESTPGGANMARSGYRSGSCANLLQTIAVRRPTVWTDSTSDKQKERSRLLKGSCG